MKVLKFLKSVGIDILKGLGILTLIIIVGLIVSFIILVALMMGTVITLCIANIVSYLLFNNNTSATLIIWVVEVFTIFILYEYKSDNDEKNKNNSSIVKYLKRKWNEVE